MTSSISQQTGQLLVFDPSARRHRVSGRINPPDDPGRRYEHAIDALLDVLDDDDAYLLDELDAAVARMLSDPRHPSYKGD